MKSPYTGGKVEIITERQSVPFKGETFEMDVETLVCVDSKKRFTTGEMDDKFVDTLHSLWRERYKVPTAQQLKAAREKLGLSLRRMSTLLGLGINQYRHYEAGKLPKPSHQLLLRLLVNEGALSYILALQCDKVPKKTLKAWESYIHGEKSIIEVEHTPKVNRKPLIKTPVHEEEYYRSNNYKDIIEAGTSLEYSELYSAA
ncbi:type II toxin-antitoxin system MqsA family antitoxin [Rufibacter glacialis]|uniref:Helix-turn-helix domain-containing protein n=1 Tax=Rufibacter glacialis TaxID=1259555 RepID=A0A5M8Q7B6_9BACT|nr:type II toxin-antitoxin system MqsA family antitoxin [Rufibacter glacialis]KAA6431008.1 helix-turn-helix domain-containing protein [Rufibacter glacialis]GGK83251.1 hypothetical protein GCM10011405_33900 [Rufibacter glacialis]